MLELEVSVICEEHVDDDTLRRGKQHLVDEFLVLVMPGVGADQLHLSARHSYVEDAGVRRVGEVEAHDLAALGLELEVRLSGDEHHVAETPHRDVRRLRLPEGGDVPALDQDVVEGDQ